MMAMMIPSKFRRRFPAEWKNLRRNAGIVSSPFDVHETLRHLLRLTTGSDAEGQLPRLPSDHFFYGDGGSVELDVGGKVEGRAGGGREEEETGGRPRLKDVVTESADKRIRIGSSLFRPLPANRRCEDAGIAVHWCTCLESTPLSPENAYAIACARELIRVINRVVEASGEKRFSMFKRIANIMLVNEKRLY